MSKIIRGYKYKIYPTEEQSKQLDQFIDLFRYVYNWAIEREEEIYKLHQQGLSKYNFYTFNELCTLLTKERNKTAWMQEIPLTTARLALRNVVNGYKMFFKRINKFPKFKSKKYSKKSFNTRKDRFRFKNDYIKIEGINSYISLGFNSGLDLNKCMNPTISKNNLGDYYVSFTLEEESKDLDIPKSESIGIDLGVRNTFALSTGEIFNQPKEKLEKLERRRKRLQRHVTHDNKRRKAETADHTITKYEDIPKSKRSIKRQHRLAKVYNKIHNIKNTFYHTITKQIVMRNPEYIVMESFYNKDITRKNKYMNKILHCTSFYDIITKMKYKCEQYNIPFIQAPKGFASTQICSNCGSVKKMYNYHTYKCKVCGMIEDRDINAAINLKNFGLMVY